MTYVLYRRVDDYGKVEVVKKSVDAKELESVKSELFFKEYVLPTFYICFAILIISPLVAFFIGQPSLLGFFVGLGFCTLPIVIGVGGGTMQHEVDYYIEYKG